jgi:SAM-dependent methyltransferase
MLDRLRDDLLPAARRLRALAGTAEHIPIATGVVDAVVCAQSFHWFATPAALTEIHRVLKPGGAFGLIWNQRDESTTWVAELGQVFNRYQGNAPRMASGQWRKLFPAPGFGPLHEVHFPHAHIGLPERVIIDRAMSVSYMAALPSAEQERVIAEIRRLIDATPSLAGRTEVSVPYVTMAFHCVAGNMPAARPLHGEL